MAKFELTPATMDAIVKMDLTAEAVGLPNYSDLMAAAADVLIGLSAGVLHDCTVMRLQSLVQVMNMSQHRVL